MAKAPLPDVLPGAFFVVVWNRDAERFSIEVDDESHSSYDLGPDPVAVVKALRLRGFEETFREQAVNLAREFGMTQCIPATERVLPIHSRVAVTPALEFEESPDAYARGPY